MWLLDLIGGWFGRGLLRLFPRVTVSGMKTIISDLDAPRQACLERLGESIETLRYADERRSKWLSRYVRCIVIWKGHYSFADRFGKVFISSEYLLEAETERVAGVLVHEATHHRLKRFGIRTTAPLKARIEAVCVTEQADFLRKFGARGHEWASDLEHALLELPWWGVVPEQQTVEELVGRGLPRPLAWLMKRRIERIS